VLSPAAFLAQRSVGKPPLSITEYFTSISQSRSLSGFAILRRIDRLRQPILQAVRLQPFVRSLLLTLGINSLFVDYQYKRPLSLF
jgi:hypothetical protein